MITIEARTDSCGKLSLSVAAAVLVLWTSRRFSTADIAELLTVPESQVAKITADATALMHRLNVSG